MNTTLQIVALVTSVMSFGCNGRATDLTPFAKQSAEQLVGRRIEAIGVARNDQKDDAIIICDGVRLRVLGLSRWPSSVEGERVRLVGTLERVAPPATSGSGTPTSQPSLRALAPGGFVVRDAKWEQT